MCGMTKRDRDRDEVIARVDRRIQARHLSPRTRKTYIGWIKRYLAHYGRRHPASMGRAEIESYLQHLADVQGLGAVSRNRAASSIVFLYRELWGVELGGRRGVRRATPPSILPKYASPQDVARVLGMLQGSARIAAMIMYGSGARVSETVAVRIKDLSLDVHELTIRAGKGAMDRTTASPAAPVVEIAPWCHSWTSSIWY